MHLLKPIGKATSKIEPRKSVSVSRSLPPWLSTIVRQIDSPSPVPVVLVVKNGSNILSLSFAPIPGPVSRMETEISEFPFKPVTTRRCLLSRGEERRGRADTCRRAPAAQLETVSYWIQCRTDAATRCTDGIRALRGLLKFALRRFGLRAITVRSGGCDIVTSTRRTEVSSAASIMTLISELTMKKRLNIKTVRKEWLALHSQLLKLDAELSEADDVTTKRMKDIAILIVGIRGDIDDLSWGY
jgi:hypothetical protein